MDPSMRKDGHYPASEGVTSGPAASAAAMPPSYTTKDRHSEGLGYQSGMPASTAQDPLGHTTGATTGAAPGASYGTAGAQRDSVASTAVAPGARSGMSTTGASDVLLVIMAIFLPLVAVFLKRGLHADFWINVLLCILAWFPGVLHALYVILKYRGVSDASGAYSKRRGI